jgi:deazaflavin-dependent oxidoreductase (nitroreductase family)
LINRLGSTRLGVWTIKHLVSPLQRWLYQHTGGKILQLGGRGSHILLLTTRGRRTGKNRTTPVYFLRDGHRIIICNVNPGFESTNPWVLNLRANLQATVQIGAETHAYTAREATSGEIDCYWPQLLEVWPAYQVHFLKSGQRAIFILERVDL